MLDSADVAERLADAINSLSAALISTDNVNLEDLRGLLFAVDRDLDSLGPSCPSGFDLQAARRALVDILSGIGGQSWSAVHSKVFDSMQEFISCFELPGFPICAD